MVPFIFVSVSNDVWLKSFTLKNVLVKKVLDIKITFLGITNANT